jgi:hypothetical protein
MKEINIDPETAEEVMTETTLNVEGENLTLAELFQDIDAAHNEIDQYKSGALTLNQALDERLQKAKKNAESDEKIALLEDMKDAAFGIYLRIHRGDLELTGGRGGEYSGYFDS